jgi:hypothetical protein
MFFSSKVLAIFVAVVASPSFSVPEETFHSIVQRSLQNSFVSCPGSCSWDTMIEPLFGNEVSLDMGGNIGVITTSDFGGDGSQFSTAGGDAYWEYLGLGSTVNYQGTAGNTPDCENIRLAFYYRATTDESLDGTWSINLGQGSECSPDNNEYGVYRMCYCPPTTAPTVTNVPSAVPSISKMPVVTSSPSAAPSTAGGDDDDSECCCDDEGKASLLGTIRSVF